MPMEGWVKCLSPQSTLGVSGANSGAAKSKTSSFTQCFYSKVPLVSSRRLAHVRTDTRENRTHSRPRARTGCLLASSLPVADFKA